MAELGFVPFSGDSHLEISPERWTSHVPSRFRDRAPRRVTLDDGGDGQVIENRALYVLGLAVTGKPFEEHTLTGNTYATGAGAGSPEERLAEQDRDGVGGEVMFSGVSGPQLWRSISDDNAYNAVVHAYNEFLAEEYCSVDRNRLLCMGVIPSSSLDAASAELEYCVSAGLKGIQMSNFPSGKGYPTNEDDSFWARTLEIGMPVTAHVSFTLRSGPTFSYGRRPSSTRFGSDPIYLLGNKLGGSEKVLNVLQLTLAGVFDRFPDLQIYFAETNTGWLPSAYEQLDDTYNRSRHWMERYFGLPQLIHAPSFYLKEHCLWGFVRDLFGVRLRHEIGIERQMWGSDFPHAAGDWPHSHLAIDEMFENVAEDEKYLMLAGNTRRYFHLDDDFFVGKSKEALSGGSSQSRA